MTRGASRAVVATAILAIAVVAGIAWFLGRSRPDAVGPRFSGALLDRRPGTTIESWEAGTMRIALPSGLYIDVRLSRVFDVCRTDRFRCSGAIDRALDDVDRIARATQSPDRASIRPMVVAESSPGYRFGYVTEPLVAALEVRYALVDGVASTFVTSAVADRLGMTRAALHDAALDALRAEPDVRLEQRAEGSTTVWQVDANGDPLASLLDPARMKAFAAQVGTSRLYAATPARNALVLARAEPAGRAALVALLARERGPSLRPGDVGVLAYDTEGGALSTADEAR